jgi:hypothetical protein
VVYSHVTGVILTFVEESDIAREEATRSEQATAEAPETTWRG